MPTEDKIKRLVIKALFADDELSEMFVLKGGSALDLIYQIQKRASIDIDISLEKDFQDFDLNKDKIFDKIKSAFSKVFSDTDYAVFDLELNKRPRNMSIEGEKFWGGYQLLFKVIEKDKYSEENIELSRKQSIALGKGNKKDFKVDISRFEVCGAKKEFIFEDFYIYVYPPLMIVNEKIRALCQQTKEYCAIIGSQQISPRPRDFFDIYSVFESNLISESEFFNPQNLLTLEEIFNIKKVPVELISAIRSSYDFHYQGYSSLKDTVYADANIKEFSFYFDYVLGIVAKLETFWIK